MLGAEKFPIQASLSFPGGRLLLSRLLEHTTGPPITMGFCYQWDMFLQ